jgi:hypothetical protein
MVTVIKRRGLIAHLGQSASQVGIKEAEGIFLGIDDRADVVAEAQIQSEPRTDAPVILSEKSPVLPMGYGKGVVVKQLPRLQARSRGCKLNPTECCGHGVLAFEESYDSTGLRVPRGGSTKYEAALAKGVDVSLLLIEDQGSAKREVVLAA